MIMQQESDILVFEYCFLDLKIEGIPIRIFTNSCIRHAESAISHIHTFTHSHIHAFTHSCIEALFPWVKIFNHLLKMAFV